MSEKTLFDVMRRAVDRSEELAKEVSAKVCVNLVDEELRVAARALIEREVACKMIEGLYNAAFKKEV